MYADKRGYDDPASVFICVHPWFLSIPLRPPPQNLLGPIVRVMPSVQIARRLDNMAPRPLARQARQKKPPRIVRPEPERVLLLGWIVLVSLPILLLLRQHQPRNHHRRIRILHARRLTHFLAKRFAQPIYVKRIGRA